MKILCKIEKCTNELESGDSFFCGYHRYQWRGFLKLNGVHDIELLEEEVNKLLADFTVSYMVL